MYTADEKVTTVMEDVMRATIKDGDEKMKLSVLGDGYGASYLSRSEVIELIEKLAKVAEQLPK